jgi:hypothetical protein
MLEHSRLLVHNWTRKPQTEGGQAWVHAIADAEGAALGFVRLESNSNPSWFSWLRKVRLEVLETEDASLLMCVTRSWGVLRAWEVDDAEGHHVGSIITKYIVSTDGARLGHLERSPGGQARIVDSAGRVLARFVKKIGGVDELTFAPDPQANPFLRMLMLGCFLTLEPAPK